MPRRTYREFKRRGYRSPATAWVMNSRALYVAAAAVGALAIGSQVYAASNSVERIRTPYEPPSPYQNISATVMPAHKWAVTYLTPTPPKQSSWAMSSSYGPEHPLSFEECNTLGLEPPTLLATYTAEGNTARSAVQVYQAGQAKAAYEEYKELFAKCGSVRSAGSPSTPSTEVTETDNGFFFVYGDALTFVFYDDVALKDEYKKYFTNRAAQTLLAQGCVSLEVTSADVNRNLFAVGEKRFTGLQLNEVIDTKVPLDNLPSPVFPTLRELPTMSQPEGPLDKSIPVVQKAPEKPVINESPDASSPKFSETVNYQVPDETGPGCGWAWTSQKEPVTNATRLQQSKDELFNNAQLKVDTAARKHIDNKLNHARGALGVMSAVETWNLYTKSVEQVHNKWRWLNDQREALMTPWYNYVEAHNWWSSFDSRKNEAQRQYTADVQACDAANEAVTEWEQRWGALYEMQNSTYYAPQTYVVEPAAFKIGVPAVEAPVPTDPPLSPPRQTSTIPPVPPATPDVPVPDPTEPPVVEPTPEPTVDIPPKPSGCSGVNKPSILDQGKGAEPKPPAIPRGVTIPESWPKPNR